MSLFLVLPLILIATLLGGVIGWWSRKLYVKTNDSDRSFQENREALRFRKDYFKGLNYLINEQPDKAVDTFIKLLDVDSDTVEMHLALGNLFRRRGEVDRAIRVHQNLIARPQLDGAARSQALCSLGKDYLEAGVLDRAEGIFIELSRSDTMGKQSLEFLLHIYQQEKDWEKAVEVATRFENISNKSMRAIIAQFNCELAERHATENTMDEAMRYLKRAQSLNRRCIRALLIRGRLAFQCGEYRKAIQAYREIEEKYPVYLSEIMIPLSESYRALNQLEEYAEYLKGCLERHSHVQIIIALAAYMSLEEGLQPAIDFVVEKMRLSPSLVGLEYLLQLYCQHLQGDARDKLQMLQTALAEILRSMSFYRCEHCGFTASTLLWLCPSCHHWETISPYQKLYES